MPNPFGNTFANIDVTRSVIRSQKRKRWQVIIDHDLYSITQ